MSVVIPFPVAPVDNRSDIETAIDQALDSIPEADRPKLRFELIKTIDSYDGFFSEWALTLPEGCDESFKKQIYDVARQEHERKLLFLTDVVRLKIQVLVDQYHRENR